MIGANYLMGTINVKNSNSNITIYYKNYHSSVTDIIIVTGNSTILIHTDQST